MPPTKHIEHTTVAETAPDVSSKGAGGGSPEQMVERSSGLLLTTAMDTKLTIYEAAYLQLARYGGVPH